MLHRTVLRESVTFIERTLSHRGSKLSFFSEHPPITIVTKINLTKEAPLICQAP